MRDLKFRAFHKELKLMRPVFQINMLGEDAYIDKGDHDVYDIVDCWEFSDIELMQSTGLDKEGVDVYEGDVFYVAGSGNCEVEICELHGTVLTGKDKYQTPWIDALTECDIGDLLGNIHENPELMESK